MEYDFFVFDVVVFFFFLRCFLYSTSFWSMIFSVFQGSFDLNISAGQTIGKTPQFWGAFFCELIFVFDVVVFFLCCFCIARVFGV